ncbi:allatostatin-A receptor-like [Gracilinanus agilis]|uniref:allatostatin-A receptor-like n=1 Tax=Gracilinanus agilis TaxID=191870 RepID=UPI001CFDDCFA|nr:allatostatin-A receptor-like [Gracilinanus agilis]
MALNARLNATMNDSHSSLSEAQLRPIFATLCGLILLVGLLANGLMLIVLGRGSGSRGQAPGPLLALTNSLMVNITLSDLVFLAYVVPVLLLTFLRRDWWLGLAVCTTSQSFNMGTMFCTFYSMVATAFLRYIAVVFPSVVFPAGRAAQLMLCLAMWLMGFSVSLPNWLYQKVVEEGKEEEEAAALGTGSELVHSCLMLLGPAQTSCYFTLLGALAFLPFAGMLMLSFMHLGWLLWGAEWPQVPPDVQQHREATGLILVVLVVFVLMWGPCSVLGYVAAVGALPDTFPIFVAISLCTILAYSNCAVSPILCFCLSRPFQAGLREIFSCLTGERRVLEHGGVARDLRGGESGRLGAPGGLWVSRAA